MEETGILFQIGVNAADAIAGFEEIDTWLIQIQAELDALAGQAGSLDAVGASAGSMAEGMDAAAQSTGGLAAGIDAQAQSATGATEANTALGASLDQVSASMAANTAAATANAAANDAAAAANDAATVQGPVKAAPAIAASTGSLKMMTLGLVGVGAAFTYFGMQAESSLNVVAALTGASADQMQQYTDGAEQLSLQMGSSLKATGDGLYYVVSAGFTGSDALNVLKYSMMDAAAGGANLADVSNGLTSAMNSYSAGADQARQYSDMMVQAVTYGKQSFEDFAHSIGRAAVTGAGVKISFDQVAAAEATMTQSGMSARLASMDLSHLLNAVGLSADNTAASAAKLGISFDETHYKTLDFIGKLEYLQQQTGDNKKAFESLVGGTPGLLAANILLAEKNGQVADTYNQVHEAMLKATEGAGASAAAFAVHQQSLGYKLHDMIAALSVLAYRFEQVVSPVVGHIFDALSGSIGYLTTHLGVLQPLLIALAAIIGGALVAVLWTAVSAVGAAAAGAAAIILPVTAIGLVVGVAVTHMQDFTNIVHGVGTVLSELGSGLQEVTSPFETVKTVTMEVHGHLTRVQEVVQGTGHDFVKLQGPLSMAAGLFDGVRNVVSGLLDFFSNLGDRLGTIGSGLQKVTSPFETFKTVTMEVHGHLVHVKEIVDGVHTSFQAATGPLAILHDMFVGVQVVLGALGGAFHDFILPALHQLGDVVQTNLLPTWKGLQAAFAQSAPALKVIGVLVGSVLLTAFVMFIGILSGTISALATIITGVVQIVSGAIQAIVGVWQFFSAIIGGILAVIGDIIHGNWSQIGVDLQKMSQGMVAGMLNIFQGLWTMIQGVFNVGIKSVLAFVGGFVSGIIGLVQGLFDHLVGHSLIPDMINAIVNVFASLPGRAMAAIVGLGKNLDGFLGGLAQKMLQGGQNLVQNLANGLKNAPVVGGVVQATQNLAGKIASFFPHSPADQGPLATMDRWMPNLGAMLATGLNAQTQTVGASANRVALAISGPLGSMRPTGTVGGVYPNIPVAGGAGAGVGGGAGAAAISSLVSVLTQMVSQQQTLLAAGGGGFGATTYGGNTYNLHGIPTSAVQQVVNQTNQQQAVTGNNQLRRPGGYKRPGWIG